MFKRWHVRLSTGLSVLALAVALVGCGDAMDAAADAPATNGTEDEADRGANGVNGANDEDGDFVGDNDDEAPPEEEEFVVEQVASTEHYVFVPNESEGSETVALIDGRDFSVNPIRVGLDPARVEAADVETHGAVGYVLSRGEPTVSVVRADIDDPEAAVEILSVPAEVNDLAMAPDGQHVLAYIDPDEPIDASASAASLQTMALVRLGDEPGHEEVYELSVTPGIDDISFTEDGEQVFISGEDGVHRQQLDAIKSDAVVPRMDVSIEGLDIHAADREVETTPDGEFLVIRNGTDAAVALYELGPDEGVERRRVVDLEGVPTDLDVVDRDGRAELVAPIRSEEQVTVFDLEEALDAQEGDDGFIEIIDAEGAHAGIGRWTPDRSAMAVFSTIPTEPQVGLVDMETGEIQVKQLRNQIRTLQMSPDSRTAVAVHNRQEGTASGADPEETFRYSEGLTLWDLETGFLRPITLHGEPEQIAMVTGEDDRPYLFVMLVPSGFSDADSQGLMRIDLTTHATEFYSLPRLPTQLGAVAGQMFVSQQQESGRITFFDIDTGDQHTVSGYELNAGIQ